METKALTAHLPLPLAEKVDQLAERLEQSHGWIVEQALAAWVEQQEERRRLTLAALADVDAGGSSDLARSSEGPQKRSLVFADVGDGNAPRRGARTPVAGLRRSGGDGIDPPAVEAGRRCVGDF